MVTVIEIEEQIDGIEAGIKRLKSVLTVCQSRRVVCVNVDQSPRTNRLIRALRVYANRLKQAVESGEFERDGD